MLKFDVFHNGQAASAVNLDGAYLIGSDAVPIRADLAFVNGQIRCQKRAGGPASLALLWNVPGFGEVLLETSKVQEREQPHNLNIELARGRLMRISQKREDWGLHDYAGTEDIADLIDRARDSFIESLQCSHEPAKAAGLADQSLALACRAGEMLATFHAEIFLRHRQQTKTFPKRLFGAVADLNVDSEDYRNRLMSMGDFVHVPIPWKLIEPREQEFNWAALDKTVEFLVSKRVQIKGGPLVCFSDRVIPPWLYIWEHDFETIRELFHDHIQRVVQRYGQYIKTWDVISGIHAENNFGCNFEQIMDLTRMSATLVKQASPRSHTIIEIAQPWGEYYARNPRTIPPMLYADMCIQSGINFDAFGLQIYFGVGEGGYHVRDLLQISSMIDRFSNIGKNLHITGVAVPSSQESDELDAWGGKAQVSRGGHWHKPWDEQVQAEWLSRFYEVAMSKPFIESISWRDLSDAGQHFMPYGGLLRQDFTPKPSFEALQTYMKLREA